MKKITTTLLLIGSIFGVSANANTLRVKTTLLCEQSDGDQWYQVAIVPSLAKSTYNILVVKNDADDESKKLLLDTAAQKRSQGRDQETIYSDLRSTVKLVVNKDSNAATFSMIGDGPRSIRNLELECFRNADLTYESSVGIEPRLGVGN